MAVRDPQRHISDDGWFTEIKLGGAPAPKRRPNNHAAAQQRQHQAGLRLVSIIKASLIIGLIVFITASFIKNSKNNSSSQIQTATVKPIAKEPLAKKEDVHKPAPTPSINKPITSGEKNWYSHQVQPTVRTQKPRRSPSRRTVTIGPWPRKSAGEVLRKFKGNSSRSRDWYSEPVQRTHRHRKTRRSPRRRIITTEPWRRRSDRRVLRRYKRPRSSYRDRRFRRVRPSYRYRKTHRSRPRRRVIIRSRPPRSTRRVIRRYKRYRSGDNRPAW